MSATFQAAFFVFLFVSIIVATITEIAQWLFVADERQWISVTAGGICGIAAALGFLIWTS